MVVLTLHYTILEPKQNKKQHTKSKNKKKQKTSTQVRFIQTLECYNCIP